MTLELRHLELPQSFVHASQLLLAIDTLIGERPYGDYFVVAPFNNNRETGWIIRNVENLRTVAFADHKVGGTLIAYYGLSRHFTSWGHPEDWNKFHDLVPNDAPHPLPQRYVDWAAQGIVAFLYGEASHP
jgi:hypothetical protein